MQLKGSKTEGNGMEITYGNINKDIDKEYVNESTK